MMKTQSIKNKSALLGLLIFLIFIFIGCGTKSPVPTQVLETPRMHFTQTVPTLKNQPPTITPLPIMEPTITITPTQSPSPTYQLTPTFIPSMTALPILPTLSPIEAETLVKDLLVNNAGCKLPCWWGFIPGTSIWNVVKQYFESFASVDGPFFYKSDNKQNAGYDIKFQSDEKELTFGVAVADTEVISDFGIPPETSIYGYQLDQLLTNSGKPEEIWLAPMPYTPEDSWYYLVLYYPTQGIIARYGGSATHTIEINNQGEATITSLKICPIGIGPELWLSSPNSIDRIMGNSVLGGEEFTDLLVPIQKATGITIEEFYNKYKNGDSKTCFETSSETWSK